MSTARLANLTAAVACGAVDTSDAEVDAASYYDGRSDFYDAAAKFFISWKKLKFAGFYYFYQGSCLPFLPGSTQRSPEEGMFAEAQDPARRRKLQN